MKYIFCALRFVVFLTVADVIITPGQVVEQNYDFRSGMSGWSVGYADYSPAADTDGNLFELSSSIRFVPRKLSRVPIAGLYMQGHNRSDDLFMFLKHKMTAAEGIVAGRTYRVEFNIVFDSNAPAGCPGAGGSPGEGVTLKAGAGQTEPLAVLQPDGYLHMNVDKGNQSTGGPAASSTGSIANGIPCSVAAPAFPFARIDRVHQHTIDVTATDLAEIWLLLGTDSGFEGMTKVYFESIKVKLVPVQPPVIPKRRS